VAESRPIVPLLGLLVGPLDLVVPRERHLVALLLVGGAVVDLALLLDRQRGLAPHL